MYINRQGLVRLLKRKYLIILIPTVILKIIGMIILLNTLRLNFKLEHPKQVKGNECNDPK